jgi:predicted phage-related endonuclease
MVAPMAVVDRDLARRIGLGASEAGGVLGVSPYMTASDVWLDKVGLGVGRADSPAMTAGRQLERPILRMAGVAATIPFHHNGQTFAHPRWPEVPLFATPDGFGPRRRVLAEVKLVGHRYADWSDGPPEYVRAQVAVQLACIPGASRAVVAALIGSDLRTYTVERDPAAEDKLVNDLVDWWYRYVVPEVAPPAETPASAWRLMKATAAVEGRQTRIAAPDEQRLGAELLANIRATAELEARADVIRRQLAEFAADSDISGVGWTAAWKQRADVSWKSVAVEAGAPPELVERFTRRSASFSFRSATAVEAEA